MNVEQARENMITQQIRANAVLDDRLLAAIKLTPREHFVPDSHKQLAFSDMHIPIGHGQVMMTPTQEALLLNAVKIEEGDSVLEVGTGSGYLTAVMSKVAARVHSIDIFPELTALAKSKLKSTNAKNITLATTDVFRDLGKQDIYDVIVISGSLNSIPKNLLASIKNRGRLFAIIGDGVAMQATLMTQVDKQHLQKEVLFETQILSLVNAPVREHFTF